MQDSFLSRMMLWEFLELLSPKSQAKESSRFFRAEEVVLRVDQESSASSRSALQYQEIEVLGLALSLTSSRTQHKPQKLVSTDLQFP